jgi:hypothetical protein
VKLIAVVGLAMLSAGCNLLNNDSTSPTTPTTVTDTWSNTLAVKGSSLYTFTVASAGTVSVTLTALSPTATVAVGLGLGTPNGTASCTLSSSTPSAIASSTPQITVTENAGTYCAQIYDVGNLTTASSFTITIVHP